MDEAMKDFDNENSCCHQCKKSKEEEVNNNNNSNSENNNNDSNDNNNDSNDNNNDNDDDNISGVIGDSEKLCEFEGCPNTSELLDFHPTIPYCVDCCRVLDIDMDCASDFSKKAPEVRIYCNRSIIVHKKYSDKASYGLKDVVQLYYSDHWKIKYGEFEGLYGYSEISAEVKLSKPAYSLYIGYAY
jgi:hypothetical protein